MTKPNVLFIFCDQLRWDGLSCTGDWAETPVIDSIAREGTLFQNGVTSSPVCIPARVSLATGQYPHCTGIWNNCHLDMPTETETWMQAFRRAGYRTSLFGKTHLHSHSGDLRDREHLIEAYGLDDHDEIGGPRASAHLGSKMTSRWEAQGIWQDYKVDYKSRYEESQHTVRPSALPLEEYADVYVGQRAKEYLTAYDRDQPWMCWVSFGGPHEPWDTPEPYANHFDSGTMPAPRPAPTSHPARTARGELDTRLEKAPNPDTATCAAMRANYAGNMKLIDDQIGEIVETIKARGEWENTIVLFSSDHGEHNGDAGLVYKETFLDGAVRVPFIVRAPGLPAGQTTKAPVELLDVGATLAELADVPLGFDQFGASQAPVVAGSVPSVRDFALSEICQEIMIRTATHKAVLNPEGEVYMLFDRLADPMESTNLAGSPETAALEGELKAMIDDYRLKTCEPGKELLTPQEA
ncbi:MAG: sulfatase family protein [Planctomycetota bacterium]|jgi:choline-sulfatase